MYPLKFKSIYHTKIWGGNKFNTFRSELPDGLIGESWDICCRNDAASIVVNGTYKGKDLEELTKTYGKEILGSDFENKSFPLLIKIINAGEKLSLQVHPGTEFASVYEKEPGKSEFWYIMDCNPGAYVVLGIKNCHPEEFKRCISENQVVYGCFEKYLNQVAVKPGDFFYVKSGLIHAVGKGILLAEIQDNSDLTYRLYDYGRGRKIEIEKALAVSDFSAAAKKYDEQSCNIQSESMVLSILDINDTLSTSASEKKFHTLTCVLGNGVIQYEHGFEKISYGDSILIPASLGKYSILGRIKLIRADLK